MKTLLVTLRANVLTGKPEKRWRNTYLSYILCLFNRKSGSLDINAMRVKQTNEQKTLITT